MLSCNSNRAVQAAPPREPGEWLASELDDGEWRIGLTDAAIAEVERGTADGVDDESPDPYRYPALTEFLEGVRARLLDGAGVAVGGRLPVERWGEARSVAAVRLITRLMGTPMSQTVDGVRFYPVRDTGREPGLGVRRSVTNVSQPFHTDGPWIARPPWLVGLYCIEAARHGGASMCLSLKALFADLAREDARLAARLARDLCWDRQAEHAIDDVGWSRHPMLWDDAGQWSARLYSDYVMRGHVLAGVALDAEAERALQRLDELAAQSERCLRFRLAPGEIEWVNNRWCAHARTAFEPVPRDSASRLLIRVWHRLARDDDALEG